MRHETDTYTYMRHETDTYTYMRHETDTHTRVLDDVSHVLISLFKSFQLILSHPHMWGMRQTHTWNAGRERRRRARAFRSVSRATDSYPLHARSASSQCDHAKHNKHLHPFLFRLSLPPLRPAESIVVITIEPRPILRIRIYIMCSM